MSNNILSDLEPKLVWKIFEEITTIPRPSKKEEKIRSWVKKWAKENDVTIKNEDEVGNLLLRKEATKGCEKFPTLVMQAHLDMVCQKNAGVEIDFENDPLTIVVKDNIVSAAGTSLGADNGIGMAYGFAALVDKELKHGPLEVLLTVDEETGLTGAFALKPGFFTGKYLLNVDSEELGTITISSAGGGGTDFILPITFKEQQNVQAIEIFISGLQGGHSGIDIDLPRLNAIKIGIDGLLALQDESIQITSINAGTAHNAIPRSFTAGIIFPKEKKKSVKKIINGWKNKTLSIGKEAETKLKIEIKDSSASAAVSKERTKAVLELLDGIFHGPISFSKEISGLVQTSNNLATVKITKKEMQIHVSTRSSVNEELAEAREKLKKLGEEKGFTVKLDEAYPGWKPDIKSPFLNLVKEKYDEVTQTPTKLLAIHAGLECGLFLALDPNLQVASIGPNIKNAHSPDEFVEIESVAVVWDIIKKLIENMGALS
ncbi:MAG: beta-Ala-His dipeptidase [Candidatus Heimdallarchaeota archaeon]